MLNFHYKAIFLYYKCWLLWFVCVIHLLLTWYKAKKNIGTRKRSHILYTNIETIWVRAKKHKQTPSVYRIIKPFKHKAGWIRKSKWNGANTAYFYRKNQLPPKISGYFWGENTYRTICQLKHRTTWTTLFLMQWCRHISKFNDQIHIYWTNTMSAKVAPHIA